MKEKSFIFKLNQIIKNSKYSVKEIADKAELSERRLRTYMNTRVPPLEQYSILIEAFEKLGEIESAEQLILQLVGLNWDFYHIGKNQNTEIDPNKIFQDLSILLGNINKIFGKLSELDRYEKMHIMIDIQNMISKLHDLIKLIDKENRFLTLWQ